MSSRNNDIYTGGHACKWLSVNKYVIQSVSESLTNQPTNQPRPITTDMNNTKDQSELGANTCNRCQAREKACERGSIGFGLT